MDIVGVLHGSFKEKFSQYGENFEYYFSMMYAVYALPNIIMPFIGGVIISRLGGLKMYFILSTIVLIGQIIFTIGVVKNSMFLIITGRFFFGLGGECLGLPQNSMIVKWFPKSGLGFPLGLTISGGRIASVLSDLISPYMAAVKNFIKKEI